MKIDINKSSIYKKDDYKVLRPEWDYITDDVYMSKSKEDLILIIRLLEQRFITERNDKNMLRKRLENVNKYFTSQNKVSLFLDIINVKGGK